MAVGALAATAAWSAGPTPALGAGVRDASVIVDLSVVDEVAGARPAPGLPAAADRSGRLLLPGSGEPVSRLYVPPEGSSAPTTVGSNYGSAGMPYGRLVVPPARTLDAVRGRSVAPIRGGFIASPDAPRVLAEAAVNPRPASGSTARLASDTASRLFPPPQGLAGAGAAAVRASTTPRASSPATYAASFPPPEPLAVATRETAPSASATKVSSSWAFSPAKRPGKSSFAAASPGALRAAVPASKPDSAATLAAAEPVKKARAGERFRLIYAKDQTALSIPLRRELEPVVRDLRQKDELRVQLAAYAGAQSDSASRARRTSLSRALAIRSHLIANGIKASRIDVRALGNKSGPTAPERVDVEVIDK